MNLQELVREKECSKFKLENKKAHIVSDEIITWLLYAAIVIAAIVGIRAIFLKLG